MENKNKEISFSDDVDDILSKMPHWLIQWGMTGILIVILLLIAFSFWIKYPEIIEGKVVLTTKEPPVKLSASQNKPIKSIFFENQSRVQKGDIIMVFKDATSLEDIQGLNQLITTVEKQVSNELPITIIESKALIIGENQAVMGQLLKEIELYNKHISLDESKLNIELTRVRIAFKQEYGDLLDKLLASIMERISEEEKTFKMQEGLFEQRVISKAQYLTDRVAYLSKAEQIDEFKKSIIQNKMSIHDDLIEIESLKTLEKQTISNLKSDIFKSIFALKNIVEQWYEINAIISPSDGQLNYLKNFYADEYVSSGDQLFAISSDTKEMIAYSYLPLEGYGKIKVNQKAKIKLNNYPFLEFGYLMGRVESISQFSNGEEYLTTIKLENGMITNTKIPLNFVSETNGTIEIITEDLRLIERVFYQIKKLNIEI
ncbi:MAG: HlyD family secretion protein [Algoriphagus aquaeductus]|uniref:HlyD family secretion protein n=1 Tax=Algoriphagus aquaeductus TaxID=475299 RepID=UPI00391B7347